MITACRPRRRDARDRLVPARAGVTNDELATRVDTSDEWIASRTGIRERRIASDAESAADLGTAGGRRALETAGMDAVRRGRDRRGHRQPRLLLPGHRDADRRAPRRGRRARLRPLGGLHRLRVRARPGLRPGRVRPDRHRARGRLARCSRGCSTGTTVPPACSSATAPARWCCARTARTAACSASSWARTARAATCSRWPPPGMRGPRRRGPFVTMDGPAGLQVRDHGQRGVGRPRASTRSA